MMTFYKKLLSITLTILITIELCFVIIPVQHAHASTIVSRVVVTPEGKGYLEVDGKPFNVSFIQNCGAQQLYCGSSGVPLYNPPYQMSWLENVFEKTAELGYNTISIILKWNEIEPVTQGNFDWTLIDNYVDWAEEYDLRIDFAWFGANSCGGTRLPGYSESGWASWVPVYLQDHDKYWGNGWNRYDGPTDNYVTHCSWLPGDGTGHDTDANYVMQCERNAVHNLFNHLAVKDTNHRTILFQVWNEPNCHYTWLTTSSIQMDLMNQLAGAVKGSNYVVATRVNMAAGVSADFRNYSNIDFVGTDTYNTTISYHIQKLQELAGDGSKIPYIGENWANLDNTSSLDIATTVNGGFYNTWSLNSHWWDSGMYDASGNNAVENWVLGTIPAKRHSGEDMTNLNIAKNKIGSKIAGAPKYLMVGFNIENDNPAETYNSFKEVSGYDIGFSTWNASTGMVVLEGNTIYAVADSGDSYINLAKGKTASMDTASYEGHPASHSVDGNKDTYAQSNSNTPWDLTIDLENSKSINRVVFTPDSACYASQYAIKVSTDNVNWTTVVTEGNGTGTSKVYDFNDITVRYIKIDVSASVNGGPTWGHAIREVEVNNTNLPSVYFKTELEPVSVTKGRIGANDNWIVEETSEYLDNGDGTYSIAYFPQECMRVVLPENKAIEKTVSMNTSSYEGHPASSAIDGVKETYAQSDSDIPWDLTIDLGSSQTINRLVFEPDSACYASKYNIQVSLDNVNYTTVATEINGAGATKTYDFQGTAARYVKIDVTSAENGGSSWGHAVREVKIYNIQNYVFAQNASMDTGAYEGHPANHAIDGNYSTYAQSDSNTPWDLTIDTESSHIINRVVFTPDSVCYASQYSIKVSTDNVNWTTVATEMNGTGESRTYDFNDITARYIKVDVTASVNGGATWGHAIREMKLYNN